MANPLRGEVGFKAGETEYALRFGANELIAIEDAFELKGIGEIGEILNDSVSMKSLRTLFRFGLIHADPDLTLERAGDIMTDIGMSEAVKLIGEAMQAAFPQGGASGTADPPPPKAPGTGKS